MKNTLKFFATAAALAAFASCNEKVEVPEAKTDVAPISISAGTESRTILRNDSQVQWIATDSLFVFDNDYNCYTFRNSSEETAATTNFLYDEWPAGKTPVFALNSYSNGKTTDPSFDGNTASAILYPSQTIYNKKSYARATGLSVGEIAYDGENYSVETMKNCFSLIRFKVKNSDITTIELTGTGNEQIAGWVDIDYSKIKPMGEDDHTDPFWTGTQGKTKAQKITLKVSGAGGNDYDSKKVFDNESWYYVALLPQVISGLSFTVTKADGTVDTQVINGPITLNRSKIKRLAHSVDSLLFSGKIVLDCTDASKFRHGDPATTLTARSGNVYNEEQGGTVLDPFDFWLDGYEDYKFFGQVTNWSGALSGVSSAYGDPKIKLPAIDGYVLTKVEVTYSHSTANRTISVTDGTNTFASCTMTRTSAASTLDLTNPAFTPASDDRYLAYSSELGAKFILTYEPEPEPTTDIVINCTDASLFVDGNGNAIANRTASIYDDTVTAAFDFWLSGKPEYVFHGQVSNWGGVLSAKPATLVKLPKISGYVLKEVNITYSYASGNRTYIITDGTEDTTLDPPYTVLGSVKRSKTTETVTKIDLTGVTASSDERYLVSPGEMCGKFVLTYSKDSE